MRRWCWIVALVGVVAGVAAADDLPRKVAPGAKGFLADPDVFQIAVGCRTHLVRPTTKPLGSTYMSAFGEGRPRISWPS